MDEIYTILKSLKPKKSPGADGVRNKILKILPKNCVEYLNEIVNGILKYQYFPNVWKEAIVICIPKPGKNLSSPSSYRPISLLPAISKVVEKVILTRINAHIDTHSIIPDFQYGFRKNHGTGHQLLRVGEFLTNSFNKRWHAPMLLLDGEQVFDRVWHDGLSYKMMHFKFPQYLTNVVRSFLTNRTLSVRVGTNISTPRIISAGVPQGSVLSPTLFNIFSADIPTDKNVLTALYADDIALLSSTNHIKYGTSHIKQHLPVLLNWYKKWRLKINEAKSEATFFSKAIRQPPNLIINGSKIPWKRSVKYLGIHLDKRLTWNKQIDAVRNKARAAFSKLQPFFRNKKVFPRTKLLAFNAIIRSIFTYAIPIYGTAPKMRFSKLEGTFFRLLRSSLNIPRFVRNVDILKDFDVPSLTELTIRLARNLRANVSEHENPTISVLANCKPQGFDKVNRPCS
ncbi:hypothetical protein HHI36_023842 [Cryptolaemus montrouzieri]